MTIMAALPFFNNNSFIIEYFGLHFTVVKLRDVPSNIQLNKCLRQIFDNYVEAVRHGFNVRTPLTFFRIFIKSTALTG